ASDGVPLIAPDAGSKTSPAGSALSCTSHAHGPWPGVHNTRSLYGTWYLACGNSVVMMRTSGSPDRRLLSPDSASAVSATTTSTFAPRSLPSVPAFLYRL